jgi:hypothetical protein
MYTIVLLDIDGCELSNTEETTLKAAKALARSRLAEPEYVAAGAHKVEVRNADEDVVYDKTVKVATIEEFGSYVTALDDPATAHGQCGNFVAVICDRYRTALFVTLPTPHYQHAQTARRAALRLIQRTRE